jgi:hypothetical protein
MIFLARSRERARVRAKPGAATLTSSPLPPREGEEVIREKALGSVIAKEIFKFGLNQALFNSSG